MAISARSKACVFLCAAIVLVGIVAIILFILQKKDDTFVSYNPMQGKSVVQVMQWIEAQRPHLLNRTDYLYKSNENKSLIPLWVRNNPKIDYVWNGISAIVISTDFPEDQWMQDQERIKYLNYISFYHLFTVLVKDTLLKPMFDKQDNVALIMPPQPHSIHRLSTAFGLDRKWNVQNIIQKKTWTGHTFSTFTSAMQEISRIQADPRMSEFDKSTHQFAITYLRWPGSANYPAPGTLLATAPILGAVNAELTICDLFRTVVHEAGHYFSNDTQNVIFRDTMGTWNRVVDQAHAQFIQNGSKMGYYALEVDPIIFRYAPRKSMPEIRAETFRECVSIICNDFFDDYIVKCAESLLPPGLLPSERTEWPRLLLGKGHPRPTQRYPIYNPLIEDQFSKVFRDGAMFANQMNHRKIIQSIYMTSS